MGNAAISWKSYTISTVARSTPESEYVAASDARAEAIFLRHFLGELGFPQPSATPIFTASTGAQAMISNSYCSFMMGLDVEASKAFDLSALPRDSISSHGEPPPP